MGKISEMQELTYDTICSNLEKGIPFSFSRWGDGEWQCLLGSSRRWNCDGHRYYPDLAKRLQQILKSEPNYHCGMQQAPAMETMGGQITNFIRGLDINWCNADLLHRASIDGELGKFFTALGKRDVVIVGNRYFKEKNKLPFNYSIIDVPHVDAWLGYEKIKKKIITNSFKADYYKPVYLFCASMMTEVLIDDMSSSLMGHTAIDCGSLFDPYLGRKTRSYHKTLVIE